MDVIIPSHNLKILSSSITTLAKIGKVLYIEFDPLDGLTIRALNDAKSSFVYFHFEVGFFERCSTSSDVLSRRKRKIKRKKKNRNNVSTSDTGRRLLSRGRRSVGGRNSRRRTLSRGRAGGSSTSSSRKRSRSRTRSSRRRNDEDGHEYDDEDHSYENNGNAQNGGGGEEDNETNENGAGDDDESADEKYLCKVPIRTIAAILRPRKGVTSLRIRSTFSSPTNRTCTAHNNNHDDDDTTDSMSFDEDDDEEMGSQMQLSFEYQIQSDGIMRVLHKVGVSNADGIIAIAPKTHCSEIITVPKVLLTMLDQVKSTSEVLLTVNNNRKKVLASTFDYGDTVRNSGENGNNALLTVTAPSILKTETSIDCNEFEDFHFMDEGAIENVLEDEKNERNRNAESSGSTSSSAGGTGSSLPPAPPEHVGEEVKLVFSIKEARAMLQFCASSQTSYLDDEDARVIVSFYWGGRPVIIETEGDAFHGELILATVDHSLLTGIRARYTNAATTNNAS